MKINSSFLFFKKKEGLENGSVVKTTYYPSEKPKINTQQPCQVAHNCLPITPAPRNQTPLASKVTC